MNTDFLGGVMAQQGMASLAGMQQAGAQPASKRKPIKVGMTVLDTTNRPYREVVVNKLAAKYDDTEPDFALIGYDTWYGKRSEWTHVMNLVPID